MAEGNAQVERMFTEIEDLDLSSGDPAVLQKEVSVGEGYALAFGEDFKRLLCCAQCSRVPFEKAVVSCSQGHLNCVDCKSKTPLGLCVGGCLEYLGTTPRNRGIEAVIANTSFPCEKCGKFFKGNLIPKHLSQCNMNTK